MEQEKEENYHKLSAVEDMFIGSAFLEIQILRENLH